MKRVISLMLACLLVFGAFPLSLAVVAEGEAEPGVGPAITAIPAKPAADEGSGERQVNNAPIAIDNDPEGGYEGDYVVIYNPSESANTKMNTGNMNGLINTTINPNVVPADIDDAIDNDMPYIIDVDAFMEEDAPNHANAKYEPSGATRASFSVGDTRSFYISSYSPTGSTSVQFKVLYKSDHCYIWTPTSTASNIYPLTTADAQTAANEFEAKFELMQSSFGNHNAGANGDGRVHILYYNINDGWTPGGGYVAGYFSSVNYNSNNDGLPVLHIDTYPAVYYNNNSVSKTFSTIVHEYQHMINHSAGGTPTWLNESMSAAAEEICYPGSSIFSRIMYYTGCQYSNANFTNPPKEYATQHENLHYGYSMYAWDQDISDILALYAQVSLFSQYLYSRAPQGNGVFKALLAQVASGKNFSQACPIVLGMSASDIVRDFRIAMTANTSQNVLDGKYGFKLQPGYDPSNYYNVQNAYNMLAPIIFTGSSCDIKGGGAITVKPVGGAYNPPAGADASLRYYGIKLNTQGGDIGDEDQPPEAGMIFNKYVRTEANGTFTVVVEAYYAGAGCTYDSSYYIIDSINNTNYSGFAGSNSFSYEFYACNGLGADGKYTFSDTPVSSVSGSNVSKTVYSNMTQITGVNWAANACMKVNGSYQGYKFVYYHKNTVFNDASKPTFSVTPGTYNVLGEYNWFGTLNNGTLNLKEYVPDAEIEIRDQYTVYDFGTPVKYGDETVNSVISINARAQRITTPTTQRGNMRIAGGNLSYTPTSITTEQPSTMALVKLSDNSHMWTKLSFLPATTVLYEEGVLEYTDGASAEWSTSGSALNAYQTEGGVYGYDASYAQGLGDSNGSAMKVTVNASTTAWPKAEFNFTGTGVDVLTRTGADTGVISVDLVPANKGYGYTGSNSAHLIIDTYFPEGTLYQIPIIHKEDLAYGEYKVRIKAIYSDLFAHDGASGAVLGSSIPGLEDVAYEFVSVCSEKPEQERAGSFTTYIDGVRIYNPLGSAAVSAYATANEQNAVYKNVRRMLRSQASASANTVLNFSIDESTRTVKASDYNEISPVNEVYIKSDMGVAFSIDGNYAGVHLSVKSPTGEGFFLKVNGEYLLGDDGEPLAIRHTSELFYDISEYIGAGSSVTLLAEATDKTGPNPILSIVNLKLIPGSANGSVEEPTVAASEDLIEFAEAICFGVAGDADRDGLVSITDALVVMRSALGACELGIYGAYCADMNGDDRIDIADALSIMRLALRVV